MKICLILSGSIAAYKACELASLLVKAGHEVQTMASEGALRFVGAASLEGLTDKPVYTDLWARRESKTHISLRRWADLFVFYPATANRINEMAAGLAPDLIGATFLANNFEKPFWIAPAMNTNMLRHPATQAALARLESWGCRILGGDAGRLACGDVGEGRLAEPQAVFGLITAWGRERDRADVREAPPAAASETRRLLLTGGAMSEAIDGVRSITNSSSGRSATAIAERFMAAGWQVDYAHHQSAWLGDLPEKAGPGRLSLWPYRGFAELAALLDQALAENAYQAIIHAAAVSDYHVARVVEGPAAQALPADGPSALPAKLESGKPVTVVLEPNPKLLPRLRAQARGRPLITAFKLSVGLDEAEGLAVARRFVEQGHADLVVWNDQSALAGGSAAGHPFVLIGRPEGTLARGGSNQELADALLAQSETQLREET